jgi:dTMP kinase
MERELASGTTIVLDRYAYSGVAFTAAKGKGLTLEWCKAPDAGLLAPDLTLFLDIPIADAAARGNFGEVGSPRSYECDRTPQSKHLHLRMPQERYETTAFQERVHEKFRELMTPDWKIIDARQSMETVAQLILRHAHDALSKRTTAPIATLW